MKKKKKQIWDKQIVFVSCVLNCILHLKLHLASWITSCILNCILHLKLHFASWIVSCVSNCVCILHHTIFNFDHMYNAHHPYNELSISGDKFAWNLSMLPITAFNAQNIMMIFVNRFLWYYERDTNQRGNYDFMSIDCTSNPYHWSSYVY